GEHRAGVEPDAESRDVRAGQSRRHDHPGARVGSLDVGIGDPVSMAVREAEVGPLSAAGNPVELVLRSVVPGPVAPVVREPQLFGDRMPIESDRVAHAARHDLHSRAVGIVSSDLTVNTRIDLANITVGTDLDVEFTVGTEI